jgi:hypothetical protein
MAQLRILCVLKEYMPDSISPGIGYIRIIAFFSVASYTRVATGVEAVRDLKARRALSWDRRIKVYSCGHDEIVLGEAFDGVGGQFQPDAVPGDMDVGVVAL